MKHVITHLRWHSTNSWLYSCTGRTDYALRVKVTSEAQPVAVALIEAKAENLPATHGLEQAKLYAESKRLNVQLVIATNGHQFVLYDRITGITSKEGATNGGDSDAGRVTDGI